MIIKNLKILTLPFCILIFEFSICTAAGIEISPARFDLSLNREEKLTSQINVANPTPDVQIFEIYADDFAEQFVFNPQSFTLESGARKTVEMIISPPAFRLTDSRIFSTTISVLARPLAESRFTANTGVKIPITMVFESSIQQATPLLYQIVGLVITLALVVYLSCFRHSGSLTAKSD